MNKSTIKNNHNPKFEEKRNRKAYFLLEWEIWEGKEARIKQNIKLKIVLSLKENLSGHWNLCCSVPLSQQGTESSSCLSEEENSSSKISACYTIIPCQKHQRASVVKGSTGDITIAWGTPS